MKTLQNPTQTDGPLVSVALITYNHADFIADCIDSILSQSYENIEIIIADDFSTDGTADIILKFAADYPEIIKAVISEVNTGVTRNHNRAFRECEGSYISWMSGDDLMLPGKIKKQVDLMEAQKDCMICYHDLEYFKSTDNSTIYLKSSIDFPHTGDVSTQIKYGCFNGGVSNMVRRKAAPSYGFDERVPIASDWLFWVETLMSGGKICYIDEVLARHRRHESNVTSFDIRSPSIREIQDHLISSEIILSNAPNQLFAIRYRKSHIYSSMRWFDNGSRYGEYLWVSLLHKFRLKIFLALIGYLITGYRR